MSRPASIIFLHGASSSGKSTLAKALQQRIELPFWHISIDHLRDADVLPMARIRSKEFDWAQLRGPFFDGYHASLAAYAQAGNNLILEHILDSPGWQGHLAGLFLPFDLLFVALHCPLDTLRQREMARRDRPLGSAEKDFYTIHQGRHYDLELQAEDGTETNVDAILAAWRAQRTRSAFFDVVGGK